MDHDGRHNSYERGYNPMSSQSYRHYYSSHGMVYPDDPGSSVAPGYDTPPGSASNIYGFSGPDGSEPWSRPSHHHHHLPDMSRSSMHGESSQDAHNLVGREGMPSPARRPQRPRIKFTQEEDELLIELKEQKNLTWKQIADFFPGRNPGTLQVRYCTRLKTDSAPWTREMDERLLDALQNYEDEKWRIVAQRVGGGVTPMGCCNRVWELFNDDIDDSPQFPFPNDG
ncbi:hypothetical protein V8C43DRAFT_288235 [Trichoderma afarasin]|nr:hypothetical protein CFAM422_001074 [Trichoderma lentiforme]